MRPSLLSITLRSIIEADLRPFEVVIGDNGGDPETKAIIQHYSVQLPICHVVHTPPLDYGGNLRSILLAAKADWVSVIHDDDFYLPNAGDGFRKSILNSDIDFLFTDHLVCSNDGHILAEESRINSARYHRTELKTGRISMPMRAALLNQVCLDGWFCKRTLVQKASPSMRWPMFVDKQYIFSFAIQSDNWAYLNEPTFVYRLTDTSLTRKGLPLDQLFSFYSELPISDPALIELRDNELARIAPVAVSRWLKAGDRERARACLHSKHYPLPISLRGMAKYGVSLLWSHLPL
jgi:glycosyltransferase involved in cell wall biosynthesis